MSIEAQLLAEIERLDKTLDQVNTRPQAVEWMSDALSALKRAAMIIKRNEGKTK